jgi:hypothetical protein
MRRLARASTSVVFASTVLGGWPSVDPAPPKPTTVALTTTSSAAATADDPFAWTFGMEPSASEDETAPACPTFDVCPSPF